ncbi:hypothetical protein BDN70DRAFT_989469 [Pholiota conissans]|uniref:F-box domain-containing protein n=1 Tax=Pholiota conissans TaxID=109636 RepID=A0A9P5ZCE7_9AGAR|nr:hypothetical protein BDN70DRAFT_989469 [Pholiota conissans]
MSSQWPSNAIVRGGSVSEGSSTTSSPLNAVQRVRNDAPLTTTFNKELVEKVTVLITKEIRRLRGEMSILREELSDLRADINTFASQIAANLPFEVLTLIFEFVCCPEDSEDHFSTNINNSFWKKPAPDEDNERSRLRVGPFYISRVCSLWRDVALKSPKLWKSIRIAVDGSAHGSRRQAALLDYWLSHSGEHPLAVGFAEDLRACRGNRNIPTRTIDILAKHAHRLYIAELLMPKGWELALSRIGEEAKLLADLTFKPVHGCQPIDDVIPFTAPRLHTVRLSRYDPRDISVSLPMAQIKNLYVKNIFDPVLAISLYPNLRNCTINADVFGMGLQASLMAPWPKTYSLQSFKLILYSRLDLELLLRRLHLPELRSFELELTTGLPSMSLLVPFLKQSAFSLTTLRLCCKDEDQRLRHQDLVSCLQELRMIRDLSLDCGEVSSPVLELMNPRKISGPDVTQFGEMQMTETWRKMISPCLVPKLETLTWTGRIRFSPLILLYFLEVRWAHGQSGGGEVAKLRSATFVQTQLQLQARIVDRLRSEGMHIEIS